jgi:hypothetical protein
MNSWPFLLKVQTLLLRVVMSFYKLALAGNGRLACPHGMNQTDPLKFARQWRLSRISATCH